MRKVVVRVSMGVLFRDETHKANRHLNDCVPDSGFKC